MFSIQKSFTYFFLFTFCYFSLFAEEADDVFETLLPEQISDFLEDNDQLVGGVISPLSGNAILRKSDLIAKGAQSVFLQRVYLSPFIPSAFNVDTQWDEYELYQYISSHLSNKGWVYYPHTQLYLKRVKGVSYIRFCTSQGVKLDYKLEKVGNEFQIELVDEKAIGISNFSGETPSGKFDFRNVRMQEQGNTLIVDTPDGKSYHYYFNRPLNPEVIRYHLQKEILPNGKMIKYVYDQGTLSEIYSCDPTEKHVYASIKIQKEFDQCHFQTNTNIKALYHYDIRKKSGEVESKHHQAKYQIDSPPFLTKISSPFYRNEKMEYCPRFLLQIVDGTEPFKCDYAPYKRKIDLISHQRVKTLFRPYKGSWKLLYHLDYDLPIPGKKNGSTTVKNPDDTQTVYRFNKKLLTSAIQYYGTDGKLKKEKLLHRNKTNWLESIELKDGQGNLLLRKSYSYDPFGNPIQEVTEGDISGNGILESTKVTKEFSADGRNLLLKEEHEQGETICYTYLPGTHLKLSKLTFSGNKIVLREFYEYDSSYNLMREISDDGNHFDKDNCSGVQERKITQYLLRKNQPFLHMPEWVVEKYFDGKEEKTATSRHLIYDSYGNVCKEEIHNANGQLSYVILKEYDEAGHLLSETNPIEQKASYQYDLKGRQIRSCNFSHRITKEKKYDAVGRLLQQIEQTQEGNRFTHYSYDKKGRLISERDFHHNLTYFIYDPIADKVCQEERPPIFSIQGQQQVIKKTTHDCLGRVLTKTDENGNVISYRYNIFGSPTEICHPNGSKEFFRYNKRGRLITYVDSEGVTTQYAYDVLGRILTKKYLSVGSVIAQESFQYNGFHLIKKVDKEGIVTLYAYDGAGRKIEEKCAGKITQYDYDALGRNWKITQRNGSNTRITEKEFDLLDRIIQKTEKDLAGIVYYKIQFEYDADGNRKALIRYINNQPSKESFEYDSYGRLIKHQDALGSVTTHQYLDSFVNVYGQTVTKAIKIDPEGVTTATVEDAYGRVILTETSQNGSTLAILENAFDSHGNLVEQKDHLYANGQFLKFQILRQTYNNMNWLESTIRGFGTNDERITFQTYTPSGKIACKVLPNQTQLLYDYSPLGYLNTLQSSDGQIDHHFEYNKMGIPIKAYDNINKITVEREVDAFGNTTKETLSTGIEIKKKYDLFDRPLSLDLGTHGEVIYTYDPLYLRKVTRHSKDHSYTHSYDSYDLDGNLLAESLLNQLGTVRYSYDHQTRQTAISSPYFSEKYSYSPKGNLITRAQDFKQINYTYDNLSQLTSEKDGKNIQNYEYDSIHNRMQKNGTECQVNELNELITQEEAACIYDLNGNLIQKKLPERTLHFAYDPLNRLIKADNESQSIQFSYDPIGRRLSKVVYDQNHIEILREYYLYNGLEEIGALTPRGKAKQQRILGLSFNKKVFNTVAIELEGRLFAPLCDTQRNVRLLVDAESKQCENRYDFSAFGETEANVEPTSFNPWRYAAKRFDPELKLVYFGKRYYDPELARWLSVDPVGFRDSRNLYQYLLNNPYAYIDPQGEFIWMLTIPILTWGATTGLAIALPTTTQICCTVLIGAAAWGGWQIGKFVNKNTDTYAPDRELPRDEYGDPIPDSENPHTQLGQAEGDPKKYPEGRYPQAREFDENGLPVRDIDFTDHCRPNEHTNPHQHRHKENSTGGTRERSKKAEPLPEWSYE